MDTVERIFFLGVFTLFAVDTLKNWVSSYLERRDERRNREEWVDLWIEESE